VSLIFLEAVEIDMQHREPAAVLLRFLCSLSDGGVEIAAVRQARQMVVQSGIFDARPGGFQLVVAGFGKVFGAL
jgi:hypothetical protein